VIDRLRLLAILNIVDCSCHQCQWEKVHDIADAVESGNAVFGADMDSIVALHATLDGVALLRQTPLLPDATA
jgi:hypothetical protein